MKKITKAVGVALAALTMTAMAMTEQIKWEKSIDQGLAMAKKTNKLVLVDFYADW